MGTVKLSLAGCILGVSWLIATQRPVLADPCNGYTDRKGFWVVTNGTAGDVQCAVDSQGKVKLVGDFDFGSATVIISKDTVVVGDGATLYGGGQSFNPAIRVTNAKVEIQGVSFRDPRGLIVVRGVFKEGSRIDRNSLEGFAGAGLLIDSGRRLEVEQNVMRGNGRAILATAVAESVFKNNVIEVEFSSVASGIVARASSDNLFQGNVIRGNGRVAILLWAVGSEVSRRNVFMGNNVENFVSAVLPVGEAFFLGAPDPLANNVNVKENLFIGNGETVLDLGVHNVVTGSDIRRELSPGEGEALGQIVREILDLTDLSP